MFSVGELNAYLGLDDSEYNRKVDAAGTKWSSLGAKLTSTGKTMTMGVTLPLVALGAYAVNTAAKFETSMNQVQAATGASATQLASLSDYAKQMGADTIYSAGEAAAAMLELAKSGMTPAQIKAGGLKAALALAAAGDLELADAATVTSNAMATFGLQAKDAASVAAALAGGANASSADVTDLAQALSQVGPGAKTAGLNLQQTVAVLSAFADKGIKGSDAGTSLKTMLTRLVPQTAQAAKAMDALGLSFVDGKGNIDDISVVAEKLQNKLGGLSQAQQISTLNTIFGSDATRAATVLMEAGAEGLKKYTKATNDKSAAEDMANARTKGTAGALEAMTGSLETAAITIGETLAPAVTWAAEQVTSLANAFGDMPPWAQETALALAGVAAAAGPVLIVVGKLASAIAAIRAVSVASEATGFFQAGTWTTTAGGVSKFGGALKAVPWALAAAGILTLSNYLGGELQDAMDGATRSISGMTQAEVENEQAMRASRFGGKAAEEYGKVEKAAGGVKTTINDVIDSLSTQAAKTTNIKTFRNLTAEIQALRLIAEKPMILGGVKLNTKSDAELRTVRDRIQSELGITRRQADAIMAKMFKNWSPQKTLNPKIDKATADVIARIDKMRTAAAKDIKFGSPNATSVVNEIARIIRSLSNMEGAADSAAQALARATTGGNGGYIPMAAGGSFVARNATPLLVGEAGPELVSVTPLNQLKARSAGSAQTLGTTTVAPTSPTFQGCYFIGSPPKSWAAFVRAHASEVAEMMLEADYSASAATARSGA